MLYYKFKNYEEFKELFGITKHGNGAQSRKNKILLTYLKNKKLLHQATTSGDYELLHISSMSELKQIVLRKIQESGEYSDRLHYRVRLQNRTFYSATYETDNYEGICEDGDKKAVRYVNHDNGGKVFKMKAGKFVRGLILETEFGKTLPEQVVIFLQEELSQEWQSYVMGVLPETTLHIDQDFEKIYSSDECVGDFESCMTDKEHHYFYQYFVDASAAYLTNQEGYIVARTIIFNKVYDAASGKVWRLAERQYSTDGNNVLHRILVDELIKGGHIDGYKQIGAGCSDCRAFVDNEGNSLSDKAFYIDCNIGYGDTLSYQDSFKWLDIDAQRAYNKNIGYNSIALDTTDGEIEGEDESEYDSYHDEYVYEVYTVYVEGREETCDSSRLGDFKHVDGEWYHVNDIETCARCGSDYVSDDGYYSSLTEEHYCDLECYINGEDDYKEANWFFSSFDNEWFEKEDDVVKYMSWDSYLNAYEESTISTKSLTEQIEAGEFYKIGELYYNDINTETMTPHIPATNNTAA
ncbi:MAG: hypothetical protein SNH27_13220 [Rikenellaceae bacterium]